MDTETRPEPVRRQNRWALSALIRCHDEFDTTSRFASALGSTHSTVFDAVSGRRDVSAELLERMADTLSEDVRAISSDPYGVRAPLLHIADCARELIPHLNGHDFGLRQAIEDFDALGLT